MSSADTPDTDHTGTDVPEQFRIRQGKREALLAEERRLKGGRVIGPLERVMVFAFAVGGNYGGVAAILAAKGILRFPEISRDEDKNGDGSRAEYVLVGSFVSWFLALALVPLF